ncbi:MAG TPA: NADH-quinone oxidoreductase subunit C [Steroidobacteraceae bacterium]|nr:NADH-quinone oxidoreductase subunit C [Steroidobacteraceae bacterium]
MTAETSAAAAAAGMADPPDPLLTLAQAVERALGGLLTELPRSAAQLNYEVGAARLLEAAALLRDGADLKFEMCMDVCGIDYLTYGRDEWTTTDATASGFSRGVVRGGLPVIAAPAKGRFAVIYQLLSVSLNQRLRLRVHCPDDEQPIVDSLTGIWASADWFEREAFDLFGIMFRGHPDLRRLLTDYGFIGHPFRKDFPLCGNVEVRYDPEKARVVYQPVSIDPRVLVPKVIRHDNRYDPQLTDAKPND